MEQQFEGQVESTKVLLFFQMRRVRAYGCADENHLVSCKREGMELENSGGCSLCQKHGQFTDRGKSEYMEHRQRQIDRGSSRSLMDDIFLRHLFAQ